MQDSMTLVGPYFVIIAVRIAQVVPPANLPMLSSTKMGKVSSLVNTKS